MGWQHTKIPAVTTSFPARKSGGFGKTFIPILNPAGPTSERQQVNGLVEGRGMTAQNNVFAVFLCAGTHHGLSWLGPVLTMFRKSKSENQKSKLNV